MTDAKTGQERLLIDPQKLGNESHHDSIDYFTSSLDGRRVAYSMPPGGSEEIVLHIVEVDSGRSTEPRGGR